MTGLLRGASFETLYNAFFETIRLLDDLVDARMNPGALMLAPVLEGTTVSN